MLSFRQGCMLAKEVGMRYEPGWDYAAGEEDPTLYEFHTDKMDARCCWITHSFSFVDSVQECLEKKRACLPVEGV